MKSRRDRITATIRDGWIRDWKLQNERSPHFVPFSKTQDFKSLGSKSRSPDFAEKGQDRDFFSTNERHFLYRLRFSNKFSWIKEQYPLLPLEKTISIAKELKVRHPTYPYTSNVHFIMTTDFYCRTIFGEEVVYSIKDKEDLIKLTARQRVNLEIKFRIERVFWESQNIKWHLITSDSIKDVFSQNLEQLYASYSLNVHLTIFRARWLRQFDLFIKEDANAKLHIVVNRVAENMNLTFQDSVSLFQHCLWHKLIIANLNIRLRYEIRVVEFQFKVNIDD